MAVRGWFFWAGRSVWFIVLLLHPFLMSVQAVLVFVLSVAAAVWLLGAALYVWPSPDQLAYGNPLPYLKVGVERPANAVKVWVEDYAGVPYEGVWFYVNGELKASGGGPGTSAYAKCGDEVRAVVKYASGVKKAEGRIQCTNPIKPPKDEARRHHRLVQTAQAYRAATGDMDKTGAPLEVKGSCGYYRYYGYYASVTIRAARHDVVLCVGTSCGPSHTLTWRNFGSVRHVATIDVFKVPDAPASQLLGGGRAVLDIRAKYSVLDIHGRYINNISVYVNGTRVASCNLTTIVFSETYTYTEHKEPNATGVYFTRIYKPGGPVFDGTLILYENKDGSYGFRVIVNPVAGVTAPSECEPLSPTGDAVMVGGFCFTVDINVARDEGFRGGPLLRFLNYLYSPNGRAARSALAKALNQMTDLEHNVQMVPVKRKATVQVYHTTYSSRQGRAELVFKTLSLSSLGAVFANVYIPIDVRLPPPAAPRNGTTRTYIASFT